MLFPFFVFELPSFKMLLICSYFLPISAWLFLYFCSYIKKVCLIFSLISHALEIQFPISGKPSNTSKIEKYSLVYKKFWTFKKIFAKLKFFPALFENIPSFVYLVFKIENKWILKLQNLFSWKTGWFKNKLYQPVTFRIKDYLVC